MKNVPTVLEGFDIEFVKLKDGEHVFHYHLKGEFFEAFENKEVTRADIAVIAEVDRQPHHIRCQLHMQGTVGMGCDRCLEKIDFPVDTEYLVIFELQMESQRTAGLVETDDQELVVVSYQESVINFSRQLYESILLEIPMLRNCDNLEIKLCNHEMLQKLEQLNHSEGGETDPRWDKLKDLLK